MKNYLVFFMGLILMLSYSSCVTPRVTGTFGSTTHFANTSTGVNFGLQYVGEFTDNLEGSAGVDYQAGLGNGFNYVNFRPALTYQFKTGQTKDSPGELSSGPLVGAYSLYGIGKNVNYYSFGATFGYRLRLNESLYADITTDQGYGSQGFNVGQRNPVVNSNLRFSLGFRF